MRLTRFAATLLTAGALLAPATMPAAHAIQVPAPTAVVLHTSPATFTPSAIYMKAGTLLDVANISGSGFKYRLVDTSTGTTISETPTIASGDTGSINVGELTPNPSLNPNVSYWLKAINPSTNAVTTTAEIVAL